MAKLLIFRGEAKHAEVELTDKTLRVGRSPEDDIVLPDPSKGVSRTHAEIRFEGGRYVLVDHQSQNGIWVAGSRVASVALERGIVASVGPYRLMIEAPPAADPVTTPEAQTEMIPRSQPPPAAPPLASAGRVAGKPAPRPRAPGPPKVRRWYEQSRSWVLAGAAALRPAASAKGRRWYEQPRNWLLAGAAALLIAASAFAVYQFARQPQPDLVAAKALVDGGNCQRAMAEYIDPALRANPNDATALELKGKCTAPPPTTIQPDVAPPPPPPTATQQLDEAEALIAAKDCPKALEKINEVLATEPENERAKGLAAQANACIAPPPVSRVPTDPPAVRLPPAEGGLDLLPKEQKSSYQKRIDAMRARYDSADSKLRKRECVQAAGEFEKIKKEVPEGYLSLDRQLGVARRCVTDEVNKNLDAARGAEDRGDLDTAADLYRFARELDPSIKVDEHLQRIADKRLQLGRQKCTEGKAAYALGRNAAAIAAFTEVLRLLPPSDPCYATAQEQQKKAQELLKKLGK